MPRYFFHYRDGTEHIDRVGTELAGIEEARDMALRSSGEAIQELGTRFWKHPEWQTWVTDENGATVCAFLFAVAPEGSEPALAPTSEPRFRSSSGADD